MIFSLWASNLNPAELHFRAILRLNVSTQNLIFVIEESKGLWRLSKRDDIAMAEPVDRILAHHLSVDESAIDRASIA